MHQRNKSSEVRLLSSHSPKTQSRPFSPAIPGSKIPLSQFSTPKQSRLLSSAVPFSRTKAQTQIHPFKADNKLKLNLNIPLFDQLPNLKKVSSLSSRSSYGGTHQDTREHTNTEPDHNLQTPPKQLIKTETDSDIHTSNLFAKSIFSKYNAEKIERKVSFKDSDTEDTVLSATLKSEHKPKIVNTIKTSPRFAVLNKVVSESQRMKMGVLKTHESVATDNNSVVSVQTNPEKRESNVKKEPDNNRNLTMNMNLKTDTTSKPVPRKRESFSANGNRKPLLEAPPKVEAQKRSSRILTKELELKYGIKLDCSGISSASEDTNQNENELKPNKGNRSPTRSPVSKIQPLQHQESTDTKEPSPTHAPRSPTIQNFILKRRALQSAKLAQDKKCMEKKQCELFIENFPESASERPRTQGNASRKIWEDGSVSERNYNVNEGEKMFVTGNTDFFKLNPESRTYREYQNIFNEELKTAESPERKETGEDKDENDLYKPMVVWFSTGGKILQPKYMTKMGSMCCTELWPKKLSLYMQKHLVAPQDCVRLTVSSRNHETVYRPKKWFNEDNCQKNIKKNNQMRRNGHDSLAVRSTVNRPKSVQTQKTNIEA